ncbi:MAG: Bug family tripartite tricarboxylate transporter substrate binding protein [Ramlibacter sp.]
MDRRTFTLAGAALAGGVPAVSVRAQARTWPTRPVRIIVPSAAGGPWDPIARHLAERLGAELGQPFIVENKSGATGMIGMDAVAKAGDGHTLGVIFLPHALMPSLFARVPFDLERDLVPVAQTHWTYNMLVVHPSVPARDVRELVALARSRPGKLSLASGGNGSPAHVMGEYFKQLSGSHILHLPYRGPLAALQDLVGGQTDMMFASINAAIPHVKSGRLRALAVTSDRRLATIPEVTTFAEVGFPRFDVRDWSGIVAPRSVPAEAIGDLHAIIARALAEPGVADRFAQMGLYVNTVAPQPFGHFIRAETARWGSIVKTAGIRIE